MPFDQFYNTQHDANLFNSVAQELIDIAGTVIKYLPVNENVVSGQLIADENFKGEYPSILYRGPYVVKGILNTIPEASKIWESMGFFSTDTASVVFNKDKILAEIGRRPYTRDRIYMAYNNTGYEITDVLELPPTILYNVQHIQVRLKKLIEGFEDIDILKNFNSASTGYVDTTYATTAKIQEITTLNNANGTIESGTSAVGLGSKFGQSDTIWNGW